MYEKAGLSSLERLIGRQISSICFVQDYVEIIFDDIVFVCYTWPKLDVSNKKIIYESDGYRDRLCSFIDKAIQSVVEIQREDLWLYFEDGDSLSVSLKHADARSAEAAMLHKLNKEIFNVWRYE